jgi:hypothetical protein
MPEVLRRVIAQGRVTPQDKEAVKLLSRGASEEEVRVLFETLRFKRTDQSGLSTPDLLRRCAFYVAASSRRAALNKDSPRAGTTRSG